MNLFKQIFQVQNSSANLYTVENREEEELLNERRKKIPDFFRRGFEDRDGKKVFFYNLIKKLRIGGKQLKYLLFILRFADNGHVRKK